MILASTPQRPSVTVAQPVWACALGYADPACHVNSLADLIAQQVAHQAIESPGQSCYQTLTIDLFTHNRQTVFNNSDTHREDEWSALTQAESSGCTDVQPLDSGTPWGSGRNLLLLGELRPYPDYRLPGLTRSVA